MGQVNGQLLSRADRRTTLAPRERWLRVPCTRRKKLTHERPVGCRLCSPGRAGLDLQCRTRAGLTTLMSTSWSRWERAGPGQTAGRRQVHGVGRREAPGHTHAMEDEIFYVLQGVVAFRCGDDRFELLTAAACSCRAVSSTATRSTATMMSGS